MPDIVIVSRTAGIGGIALKAAALVEATTAHPAVQIDTAAFAVQVDWVACEIASNDELYIIDVEANTKAAPTVWTCIGGFKPLGATEKLASSGDTTATGSLRQAFHNPQGYQVRLKTWVSGSIAGGGGINYSAAAFPIDSLSITG